MYSASGQSKIAVIACYFGKLPWYFKYFIHSCVFNAEVDFIVITDSAIPFPLPSNILNIKQNLNDINVLATKKLGFKTNIQTGYKFCDFKPVYGLLFSELLTDYEFWGQTDIDVIFGDIRYFADRDMLSMYDYISVRHDIPSGCFSLFRNTQKMNSFFMKSQDYVHILSSKDNFCFDECNYAHNQIALGESIFDISTEIESFMHIVKKAEFSGEIKAHFDLLMLDGMKGRIRFDKGKLLYRNRFEAILYHLIDFKWISPVLKLPKTVPNRYRISPSRIYSLPA